MPRRSRNHAANAADAAVENHVAGRMRLRRGLLGLSQADLAGALGITFQQVQKYERGSNRISVGKLYRLADILGVPLTFFFDGLEGGPRLSGDVGDAAGILSRRELDLVRAWRTAPPEVSDAVSGLLRAVMPDEGPAAPSPPTAGPEPVEAAAPARPAKPPLEAPRRRRSPGPAGKAEDQGQAEGAAPEAAAAAGSPAEAPRRRGRPPGSGKRTEAQVPPAGQAQPQEGRPRRRTSGAVWDPADIRDYGDDR